MLTGLALDESAEVALHRQLYEKLRQRILDGRLEAGERLPSTRMLADELGLSRNTVKAAYEQLAAEGYIESRVGAGSRVTAELPEAGLTLPAHPAPMKREPPPLSAVDTPLLSRRGQQVLKAGRLPEPARTVPFAAGIPALDAFPRRQWNRLAAQVRSREGEQELVHGAAQGFGPLRREIAAYLNTARGVRCTADNVLVLSSSQQGLDLAARVLLDPGDEAWIEEPGYLGARGALVAAEARAVPVPVDEEGIDVEGGRSLAPGARLAYVTPSHQFPLGHVCSLKRRLELLAWASEAGAWILEDDYDSEYRYRGHPVPSLQGLDESGRVIYVGTFTKVLFPSLRLAYLVCPPQLVEAFVAARTLQDGHVPTHSQAITAEFLGQGLFSAHLRRMRALYAQRQETLRRLVDLYLGDAVSLRTSVAGMHLVAHLPEGADDRRLSAEAARRGVATPPLSRYYMGEAKEAGLLLGYTAFSEERQEAGIQTLAKILG